MPVPLSFTLTINSLLLSIYFSSRLTYIISPSFVNFKALLNKLEITCEILPLSASITKRSAFCCSLVVEGDDDSFILRW